MWSSAVGVMDTNALELTRPDETFTYPDTPEIVCAVSLEPFIVPRFVVQLNASPLTTLLDESYPVAVKV